MRILVAEDDPVSRKFLVGILKIWDYEPLSVEDGTKAWEELCKPDAPNLVLLDWDMPGLEGIEVCRRLKDKKTSNPPYVILLTGKVKTRDLVEGLNSGASDYVRKPYNNEELRARLMVGRRMLNLQSELNEAKEILAYQAMRDPLTHTYNRRAIQDIFRHEISRTRRLGKRISIGICDIDHFKKVNDMYGHLAGDEVLVAFALGIQSALRGTDYLGRWGGEEFIIIAPDSGREDENTLFQRICRLIEQKDIPTAAGIVRITVSIGVSIGTGEESPEELFDSADKAMYQAKRNGRNRVFFAEQREICE